MSIENINWINWIEGTPVGLIVRKVESVSPHTHSNLIEIVLCLHGQITISYFFEEFTLEAGEFILVDRDAHFLYGGKDAVCVSFYFDLVHFKDKHLYIDNLLFVCEGTKQSTVPYDTPNHKYLKAMLIALLTYLLDNNDNNRKKALKITNIAEDIIDLMIDKFDIVFWYHPGLNIEQHTMIRYRKMMSYLSEHHTEKICLKSLSREFGLSKAYVSEFLSSVSLGFQGMLNYIRAAHAAKMLIETDAKVLDVSEACGFSDPKYFYKVFKYWYFCTPKQFREKYFRNENLLNKEELLELRQVSSYLEDVRKRHFVEWFMNGQR